jgi:hypothetical protein
MQSLTKWRLGDCDLSHSILASLTRVQVSLHLKRKRLETKDKVTHASKARKLQSDMDLAAAAPLAPNWRHWQGAETVELGSKLRKCCFPAASF